jgi:hypothetical protein
MNNEERFSAYDKWVKYGPNHKERTNSFVKKENEAFDFLESYGKVFNHYSANVSQPNPFSTNVMFIIDTLNKANVKSSIDIFKYHGSSISNWEHEINDHKLVNIIAEPNPQAEGAALLFVAHHDVANTRSENAQDNKASVSHLLTLANLIKNSKEDLKRVILLFSDCEEFSAKGAYRFADNSKLDRSSGNPKILHNIYGEISGVINLELSGVGKVIWSDCEKNIKDIELHDYLEKVFGGEIIKVHTPPSDVIAFRRNNYPTLCIGTLKEDDVKERNTWRLCHSINDTVDKCSRGDMKDFTGFLFDLTKKNFFEV